MKLVNGFLGLIVIELSLIFVAIQFPDHTETITGIVPAGVNVETVVTDINNHHVVFGYTIKAIVGNDTIVAGAVSLKQLPNRYPIDGDVLVPPSLPRVKVDIVHDKKNNTYLIN